jgi:hypothetical protein
MSPSVAKNGLSGSIPIHGIDTSLEACLEGSVAHVSGTKRPYLAPFSFNATTVSRASSSF